MLTAITREVSPCIEDSELTFLARQPIDYRKAAQQHKTYERCLSKLGVKVVSLPAEPQLPDAVFVEDTAVVVDELAVVAAMGAAKRESEVGSLVAALSHYRTLRSLNHSATLEGGDVVRIGRTLYVGVSSRTNQDGIAQLRKILDPYDYQVRAVEVEACLHLSTGCSYLGRNTLLVNSQWIDTTQFDSLDTIDVSQTEPFAANVKMIGEVALVSSSFPRTGRLLEERGWSVQRIDISELEKAEAGLTCLSLIFSDG
jgi:dimethylargininase